MAANHNSNVKNPSPNKKVKNNGCNSTLFQVLFLSVCNLIFRDTSKNLTTEDLPDITTSDISNLLGNEIEEYWISELENAKKKGRRPKLLKVICRTFILGYMIDGFLLFFSSMTLSNKKSRFSLTGAETNLYKNPKNLETMTAHSPPMASSFKPLGKSDSSHQLITGQIHSFSASEIKTALPFVPVMLALFVSEFDSDVKSIEKASFYAAGLIILTLIGVIINFNSTRRTLQRGMRIRIACCSLLYRKMLRLSSSALNQTTAGQLVNIMSNDVNRFDLVLVSLHHLWIMPFQISLMCYLIYVQVNIAAVIGVVTVLMQTLPLQLILGKFFTKLRLKIAVRTDERVRLMHEIIRGIQVIKMYAWEQPFEKAIARARETEMSAVKKTAYIRGIAISEMIFTERSSLFNTLLAYTLMGYTITASTVFSLAQFFNKIQEELAFHFPAAVAQAAECLITIRRIEDFLMLDEFCDQTNYIVNNEIDVFDEKQMQEKNAHINRAFDASDVLSESEVSNSIEIKNLTAAWTKEHNTLSDITFSVKKGKLYAIVGAVGVGKSSLLQLLLKEIPILSGSVQINGSLSYASQDPWLFIDTVRNNILFGQAFNSEKYKSVVRICALSDDFKQFPHGDKTLVGERGISLSGGQKARISLARTLYKEADIYLLDDPLSAVDSDVGAHIFQKCISGYLENKTRILVTHQLQFLENADCIIVLENGKISSMGTYEELKSSDKSFSNVLATFDEEEVEEQTIIIDAKHPVERRSLRKRRSTVCKFLLCFTNICSTISNHLPILVDMDPNENQNEVIEETKTGETIIRVFLQYWKAGRCNHMIVFTGIIMILGQIATVMCDFWVSFWSSQHVHNSTKSNFVSFYSYFEINQRNDSAGANSSYLDIWEDYGPLNSVEYLYIYGIILIACVVLVLARSLMFFKMCVNSSKGLHDDMFHKILRTKMKFFNDNSSGRILNRFSKDIGTIDESIPQVTIQALQITLVFIGILVLVIVTNLWLLVPAIVILILFRLALGVYFATAQNIKVLETTTRSPVFAHVTSSLNGIVTIRASRSQYKLVKEFDSRQDIHTTAFNSYIVFNATIGYWLDIICLVFLTCICFVFVYSDDDNATSSNVGLAISQTLVLLGMLQFGMHLLTETFVQMTSVERVLQYSNLEEEEDTNRIGMNKSVENWPTSGSIEFKNVCLRYSEASDPVLKNINFAIESGFKVGIVGRTGAGKSSLIAALFRLAEIEGKIEIDGVDTKDVSLENVRSNISIIPQNPILFSNTIRYNLDPNDKHDDEAIWTAIEDVGLKGKIPTLDFKLTEDGSNLSVGQKQLVCLARAMLGNNKILVMDEATANVDPETDSFIQKTIRTKFADSTVLTIAHRLNTIIDSNSVLVIDNGQAVEFDHPYTLLRNENSYFYKIVQQTGSKMFDNLLNIAKETYDCREKVTVHVEDAPDDLLEDVSEVVE
ncbi:ATP-binding cassette sub-family C member 4-like [Arctopsyche grandis]|uniref:ATP-binding cassette sub-family C member 4-like n=1 Tax=Arctopsyche grandis TaxID=121162 RepID=UPI00406D8105